MFVLHSMVEHRCAERCTEDMITARWPEILPNVAASGLRPKNPGCSFACWR